MIFFCSHKHSRSIVMELNFLSISHCKLFTCCKDLVLQFSSCVEELATIATQVLSCRSEIRICVYQYYTKSVRYQFGDFLQHLSQSIQLHLYVLRIGVYNSLCAVHCAYDIALSGRGEGFIKLITTTLFFFSEIRRRQTGEATKRQFKARPTSIFENKLV